MGPLIASQVELIPGYRLLERLGHGGYGEVWKAEAPGGLLKAIKIVHGSVHNTDDEVNARQELKALERVKAVRHPYILSLERYDIVNDRLIIVMELADRDLWDRFKECRTQGLLGIPRDELLRYMEETAEALDLMNIDHQLQHLDIKPQNLFLVHSHVKVADFGLVKQLEGVRTQVTSGMTALYAPPETFEGQVSRFCDQYSLAIVYQELLTGERPFTGNNPRQLMMRHLTTAPELGPLPPTDRGVIARALSKRPEDRFPSCGDLVQALWDAAPPARSSPSSTRIRLPGAATPVPHADGTPAYHGSTPDTSAPTIVVPHRPSKEAAPDSPAPAPQPETPPPPERAEVTGDGVLLPALVIGLGAAGREILRHLRKGLHKRCGPPDALPHLRYLLIDADADELREATLGDTEAALRENETLFARLQRPASYLKSGLERQALEQWLHLGRLARLPRDQTTPGGWRALGRLAFTTNFPAIAARLRAELEACTAPEALAAAERHTGLGLRTNWPRVYVVASLGGGTGGGMFLDVAYAVRHRLRQMGYARPDVVGLFLLPAAERGGAGQQSVVNAYAALTELGHFAARHTVFSAGYQDKGQPIVDADPPFGRCVLLPLPREERTASLQELAALAGDFLGRDLATPLGKTADQERLRRLPPGDRRPSAAAPACQTFGSYWFVVPRRLLLRRVAQCLCDRLVKAWRAENPKDQEETVRCWIADHLARGQLQPEQLATGLEEVAAVTLGQAPQEKIEAILARLAPGQPSDVSRHPEAALEAIEALQQLVGTPDSRADAAAPTPLGQALAEGVAALRVESDPPLAELALHVLAEPHFRLLGLEEMVQARVGDTLAQRVRAYRVEADKLARDALGLYRQAGPLLETLRRGSLWAWSKRRRAADELLEVLRRYGTLRAQALLQHALGGLYQDLQAGFQKHLRKVSCCRRRITQFLKSFEDSAHGRPTHVDLGLGQYLLPAGCRTLPEAVEQILATLTPQELEEINARVQDLIGRRFEAQLHVCTASADFFKDLEEEVVREVVAFAEAPLGRAHAAEVYLEQRGRDEAALTELAGAFEEAAPELAGSRLAPANEFCVLAVPPGPEGEYFRGLVRQALPDRSLVPAASTDDIVFYREVPRLPLAALPQLGPAAEDAYRRALAAEQLSPHSRTDIAAWLPVR